MAASRNITIYSGDTYIHELRLKNSSNAAIDISTRIFSGQIRIAPASTDPVANFVTTITDGPGGIVLFSISSNNTALITPGTYYYDFQQIDGSIVTTLIAGKAVIQEDVTYAS